MDAVQRRGSCARMNYIKRFLAFVLVAVMLSCFVMVPTAPRAEAVAGVDDAVIAAFILVASAMGLSFVSDSSEALANYISNYLAGFTSSGGFSVVDIVVSWVTGGSLRLSQDQALFMTEAVINLAENGGPIVVADASEVSIDGFKFRIESPGYSMPLAESTRYVVAEANQAVVGDYYPFSWSQQLYIRITRVSATWIDGTIYIDGVANSTFSAYHQTGALSFGLDIYLGADNQITGLYLKRWTANSGASGIDLMTTNFGAVTLALLAGEGAGIAFGTVATELADLANQMDAATEAVVIPTVLDPAATIAGAQAGTLAVPQVTVGEKVVAQPGTAIGDLTLTAEGIDSLGALMVTKFPFSIPWDFARAVGLLAAPAEAPYWEVDFMAPIAYRVGGFDGDTTITIDFAQFDALAAFCRWVEVIVFCAGLAMATKRLIWT